MKHFVKLIILTVCLSCTATYAGKIIKWVDKNGVTHYGDKPPLPSKTKKSSVLNNQGVTVKEIDNRPINTKIESTQQEQSRYDKALLATYSSVDEIELAKERNTRIDKLALEGLELKHQTVTQRIAENNKTLLEHAKNSEKAPQEIITKIEQDTASLTKLEKQISARKDAIAAINQRYAQDKERYTQLRERKGQLYDINQNQQSIAELRNWKADVEKRLASYQSQSLQYTRRGRPKPRWLTDGLLQATQELERANQEIKAKELAIKKSKSKFSK